MRSIITLLLLVFSFSINAQVNFSKRRSYNAITNDASANSGTQNVLIKENFNKSWNAIRENHKDKKGEIKKIFKNSLKSGTSLRSAKDTYDDNIKNQNINTIKDYGLALANSLINENLVWFPARNRFMTRYYYTDNVDLNVNTISNNYFSINAATSSGSVYSEIIAGYKSIFRISLGGMVSKTDLRQINADEIKGLSSNQLDSLVVAVDSVNASRLTAQNILGAGGNLILNFTTPLVHYQTDDDSFISSLTFFNRIGFAVPKIGTAQSVGQVTNQIGLQAEVWINLSSEGNATEDPFAFTMSAIISQFTNQKFAQDIGYENKKSFGFFEVSGAFEIANRFRIGMNFPFLLTKGADKDQFKPQISATIIPF